MPVEVLDASHSAAAWYRILGKLPPQMRDVYWLPQWTDLHRFEAGSLAKMFTYRRRDSIWAYPFLLQPILHVGRRALDRTWFDITTAYGYGGPLTNDRSEDFLSEAYTSFDEWCENQGVVAEFVRFHPLLRNESWIDPRVDLVMDRETVSIQLTRLGSDDLPYGSTACNMLRRAARTGMTAQVMRISESYDQFVEFYLRAMDRLHADSFYYFSDAYFRDLKNLIRERGYLLVAECECEWIAAAVFLKGDQWLHYHLSASNAETRVPGATNLLLHEAAQAGFKEGLSMLHLGGGRSGRSDDSLLKFKKSMGTATHPFFVGRRIHNQEAYTVLRAIWEQECPSLVSRYDQQVLAYRHTVADH